MQYAQVAVDTKTSLDRQTFTYSIPPELLPDIKSGILVLVPFHGRKIQGVILSLKHLSTGTLKQKIKPIIKIIDPNPVLDSIRLEMAKWMSGYYLTPIGEVIFAMIPPVAMRQIKNNADQQISKLGDDQASQKNAIALFCDKEKSKSIYTLYNRMEEREETYIKLIEKSIAKNKNCLVLFPNIDQAKEFQNKLDKKNRSVLYHSEMTRTERYIIWNDIGTNKYQVIIGTRPTVFAPINNLGLIIIDQPDNFGYKEDQSSRYHSRTVAKHLNQLCGSNLVLGSSVPNIETYYFEQSGKYHKLKNKIIDSKTIIIKRIIDISSQKNKIISWELEESIESTLQNCGKVLLFSQRKGEGSSFICQDCGYVFKCDKCNLPYSQTSNLKPQISNLQCHRCNVKLPIPKSCSNCRGVRLKSIGLGVDKIQCEISKLFPNVRSIVIDVDSENIEQKIDNNQIIISTKKIIDFPKAIFDLVGIVNIDNLLNLPDYKSNENVYMLISNLIYQCKKDFILQTYNTDNELWDFIKDDCPNVFLSKELSRRKKYFYPPFSQLIKLVYQNEDQKKCQEETENLKFKIQNLKLTNIGPSPCFIGKIRNKFQYQILVFINNATGKHEFVKIVSKLPKGWKIDVDPISLI